MNPKDLPEYIWPFIHLFNKIKFKKLLERYEWNYKINLTEEALRELNTKAYAMTLKEEEAFNQWLYKQLKAGLILESKSRYTVPCFYIPRKDSSLWLVQDYKKLNQVTIKDKIPLPLIGEVINKLKEAKYFNKLDLIWGYNNVWIKEGDKWKAAFLTNKSLCTLNCAICQEHFKEWWIAFFRNYSMKEYWQTIWILLYWPRWWRNSKKEPFSSWRLQKSTTCISNNQNMTLIWKKFWY